MEDAIKPVSNTLNWRCCHQEGRKPFIILVDGFTAPSTKEIQIHFLSSFHRLAVQYFRYCAAKKMLPATDLCLGVALNILTPELPALISSLLPSLPDLLYLYVLHGSVTDSKLFKLEVCKERLECNKVLKAANLFSNSQRLKLYIFHSAIQKEI